MEGQVLEGEISPGDAWRVTRTVAAQALSLLGHPALVMPGAVAVAALNRNAPSGVLQVALASAGVVAASVIVCSLVQVRAGRWSHVDASAPQERRQLNLFLALLLLGVAGLLWWSGQPWPLVLGLGVAGALVVVAHLLRRWLKLSLHACFAVFAAGLLWPSVVGTLLALALAGGVAWSRLVLGRHTPLEVAVGLTAGAVAGIGFYLLAG